MPAGTSPAAEHEENIMSIDLASAQSIAAALIEAAVNGHGNLIIAVVDSTPTFSYSAGDFENQIEAFVDSHAPGDGFYDRGDDSEPPVNLASILNNVASQHLGASSLNNATSRRLAADFAGYADTDAFGSTSDSTSGSTSGSTEPTETRA